MHKIYICQFSPLNIPMYMGHPFMSMCRYVYLRILMYVFTYMYQSIVDMYTYTYIYILCIYLIDTTISIQGKTERKHLVLITILNHNIHNKDYLSFPKIDLTLYDQLGHECVIAQLGSLSVTRPSSSPKWYFPSLLEDWTYSYINLVHHNGS